MAAYSFHGINQHTPFEKTAILQIPPAAMHFIAALGALVLMMRLLKTVSFTPYVIYRVVLGLGLLAWAYA